jgi:rSAM/selenodomain-associated transferase 1
MNNQVIFIFCRVPLKGKIKTRLAKSLGVSKSYDYYKEFLHKTLNLAMSFTGINKAIFYFAEGKKSSYFDNYRREFKIYAQEGSTFNQRLSNAFLKLFDKGYHQVIMIASDSPDLPIEFIQQGSENLKYNDAVIGETEDGGYYLLGLKDPSLLKNIYAIPSSTTHTFENIKKLLRQKGKRIKELPKWYDIDTLKDLRKYLKRNSDCHSLKLKSLHQQS